MDKAYLLNDYVKEQEQYAKESSDADYYLEQLNFRIHGSKSIEELKKEVNLFLEKNQVPVEVKDKLLEICGQLNDTMDVYQATLELENYMQEYALEQKKNTNQSNQEVSEIKEDMLENVEKRLEEVEVHLTGDKESILDRIQNENDVYKLDRNTDEVVNYYQERKEVIPDKQTIELSTYSIEDAINQPDYDTMLNTTLEESRKDISSTNEIQVEQDGTLRYQGNMQNPDTTNFMFMLVAGLVVANSSLGIHANLDMKFIKDINDLNSFEMIFGNFPLTNHPENKLDPEMVKRIQSFANSYRSQINYQEELQKQSPEIVASLLILQEHVLGEKGNFQMAIRNDQGNLSFAFKMGENYQQIADSFQTNGAMVSQDEVGNSVTTIYPDYSGNQLLILTSTLASLNQYQEERRIGESLSNTLVYQKIYQEPPIETTSSSEAGNVYPTFFIITLIAEAILVAVFLLFLFLT